MRNYLSRASRRPGPATGWTLSELPGTRAGSDRTGPIFGPFKSLARERTLKARPSAARIDLGASLDKRYELFCLADSLFYDSPSSSRAARQELAVASRPLPVRWTRTSLGEWQVQLPPGDPVPKLS